jgi:hypothetical protein
MTSSAIEIRVPSARDVGVSDEALTVELNDGRTLSVPLSWYPRLWHATPEERNRWRFIGNGLGVHWPDLDEDISIEGLLFGRPSGESPESLKKWLQARSSAERPDDDLNSRPATDAGRPEHGRTG